MDSSCPFAFKFVILASFGLICTGILSESRSVVSRSLADLGNSLVASVESRLNQKQSESLKTGDSPQLNRYQDISDDFDWRDPEDSPDIYEHYDDNDDERDTSHSVGSDDVDSLISNLSEEVSDYLDDPQRILLAHMNKLEFVRGNVLD